MKKILYLIPFYGVYKSKKLIGTMEKKYGERAPLNSPEVEEFLEGFTYRFANIFFSCALLILLMIKIIQAVQ